MKVCCRCKGVKTLSEFTANKTKKDGVNPTCTDCHRQYTREHYKQNKGVYKDKARKRNLKVHKDNKKELDLLKSVPCTDCGVQYPPYIMDFDHVNGDKLMEVSRLLRRRVSLDVLKAEVAKCEVVCSNCHRERTYQRRSCPRNTTD